jgi:hypothetical protein
VTHRPMARRMESFGMALGLVLIQAGLALGASGGTGQGPTGPSYAIPNIVAAVMCLATLAIACKDFRRA